MNDFSTIGYTEVHLVKPSLRDKVLYPITSARDTFGKFTNVDIATRARHRPLTMSQSLCGMIAAPISQPFPCVLLSSHLCVRPLDTESLQIMVKLCKTGRFFSHAPRRGFPSANGCSTSIVHNSINSCPFSTEHPAGFPRSGPCPVVAAISDILLASAHLTTGSASIAGLFEI